MICTYALEFFNDFRPELNIVALQPWTNLKIPEKVDAALEEVSSNHDSSQILLTTYNFQFKHAFVLW